jgi:hypothetical protein
MLPELSSFVEIFTLQFEVLVTLNKHSAGNWEFVLPEECKFGW